MACRSSATSRPTTPCSELHVRAEVLDHHVGLGDQPLQGRDAVGLLEVERDGALVAMRVLEYWLSSSLRKVVKTLLWLARVYRYSL